MERVGVRLALDLEDIEGQKDDLSDSDEGTGGSVHDRLSGTLTEGEVKLVTVVGTEVVTDEGLTSKLVDALENLVTGGVSETGEEGEELTPGGRRGVFLEDYGVECIGRGDLALVGHQTFRNCVHGVEDGQLSDSGGAWEVSIMATRRGRW